jgi:cytoskeletal protein RodZ
MSSLLRPVGHLPASVYWFRRGLVLVATVILLVLLINLFGGGGGGQDPKNTAATDPTQTPSAGPSDGPSSTPTSTPTDRPTGKQTIGKTGKTTDKPSASTTPKDLQCAGSDVRVDLIPAARTVASGAALNFAVQLTALGDECKASLDPTVLSLTIASGKDQIWTSTQCEQSVPRTTLVVAKGNVTGATILWNGRRSAPGCLPGQLQAKPGTYVAKAVYDGNASATQAFQIS